MSQLPYAFAVGVADFFAKVGEGAPVTSLADVIAINNEELANHASYGRLFLIYCQAGYRFQANSLQQEP